MDLVVDQVVELQHVDVANGHLTVELLTRTAIIERRLTGFLETGKLQHLVDVGFHGTVEDRRRDGDAAAGLLGQAYDRCIVVILDRLTLRACPDDVCRWLRAAA